MSGTIPELLDGLYSAGALLAKAEADEQAALEESRARAVATSKARQAYDAATKALEDALDALRAGAPKGTEWARRTAAELMRVAAARQDMDRQKKGT